MKTIVIEDEQPSLELMKRMVEKTGVLELSGAYTDPQKALADIPQVSPDVIFADIEMPFLNGMELARKIKKIDETIQIVFVTAYEEYALEAFRVNAVDYILKPITKEDLEDTVNRLTKNYNCRRFSMFDTNRRYIVTFGSFTVYGEHLNQKVQWPTAKVRELFACFVMSKGEMLEKWELCERLWPQSPPKRAEHNLHSTINRLKNALQEAGIPNKIFFEEGGYRIDMAGLCCDSWKFQMFLEGNPVVNRENLSQYEKILPLYTGDLFAANDYIWSFFDQEKFRNLYLTARKKVGRYFLERNQFYDAEKHFQQALQFDPFDEEAVLLLLRLYAEEGNKRKLMDCYTKFKAAYQKDLNTDPSIKTARYYYDLLAKM